VMDNIVVAALALALGLVLGAGLGARRTLLMLERYRGSSASIARFLPSAMPHRTAQDALAGRVRVLLAGTEHAIPVLTRAASREWLRELDAKWGALPGILEAAGDDVDRSVAMLLQHTDAMLDSLIAYDRSGVLPPRDELDSDATDAEILQATVECWLAANPLAASIVGAMENETNGTSPVPPSSALTHTAGVPTTSSTS
jgi:hypothetical protein